jgi:uncharacterized protein
MRPRRGPPAARTPFAIGALRACAATLVAWVLATSLAFAAIPIRSGAAGTGAAPAPPVLAAHVTDLTGTLQPDEVARLEAVLVALEKRKGSQLAVLLVPTTGGDTIEGYALAVAEKNKLGRVKVDDGLLLLVAKDDRKARIEVGYGLEGVVTDALSSRVIREYLAPKFRQGDYAGGLEDAVGVLVKLVDGEPLPEPMTAAAGEEGQRSPSLLLAIVVGLFVGMFAGGTRLKPVLLRRLGAGGIAAGIAWLVLGAFFSVAVAGVVAFLIAAAGGGRFGSGRGHYGAFPGGGWGGGGFGGGGGGGWSGGGGSFGGGGASGGW